jgi:pimeloyl-ACP methyl ester carboxylesterase
MSDTPYFNQHKQARHRLRRTNGVVDWLRGILLILALVILILAILGASYQAIATWMDARNFPPPGQMVDVGGYRMHVYCSGSGSPTVVLDALFPGTVSNWAWVQPEIAKTTRVCAYDRAGQGWSDSGPKPRDALHGAHELHALLEAAEIPGPYILVGHSLGGLTVRMFADQYPDEVVGMVLIEATNPDSWKRLGMAEGIGVDGTQLAIGAFLARFGIFRLGLLQAFSMDPDLPEQQRLELQAFFNSVKSFETARDVNASFSVALDQVRRTGSFGAKPLAILLGSNGDGSNERLQGLFAQQAELSSNSITQFVDGATHAGLVDNQKYATQTSATIRQVFEAARSGQSLAQEP